MESESISVRIQSREAIRRAAAELLASDPSASLAQVAARAGVGRATLHRHFQGRAELVRAVALEALDATDAVCAGLEAAPSSRAALGQLFEAMVPLGAHYAFLIRCPVDDPEVEARYAAQVEQLRKLVEWLRADGWIAPTVPTAWAVALIDQLIWSTWTLVARGEIASREAARLAIDTVLHGMGERMP